MWSRRALIPLACRAVRIDAAAQWPIRSRGDSLSFIPQRGLLSLTWDVAAAASAARRLSSLV
jgi:hypothetical protein